MNNSNYLLKEIEYFSQSRFKGIYSRPFFNHVIMEFYNAHRNQPFSLIYGDFSRVNDINQLYSMKTGDTLLERTFQKINSTLAQYFPENTFTVSSIGGDEFAVLIDNAQKDKLNECFENLHTFLQENSISALEKQYGEDTPLPVPPNYLDFSYGVSYSNGQGLKSVYDIYHEAEKEQESYKLFADNKDLDFQGKLDIVIETAVNKFFKNFRFSNYFPFQLDRSKDLALASTDSIFKLLTDPSALDTLASRYNEISKSPMTTPSSLLSPEQCKNIYEFIINPSSNQNLENLSPEELTCFLDSLIRQPVSGCYNKSYFNHFFVDAYQNSSSDFSTAILIDINYMKDSNFKIGHSATDKNLKLFSSQLQSQFKDRFDIDFSNENYTLDENGNYILALGGGNYLLLMRDFIDYKDAEQIVKDSILGCEPLGVTCFSENIQGRKDLKNVLQNLQTNCEQKKEQSKKYDLNFSNKDLIETLELFFAPTVKYYLDNNPANPHDISEQKKFITSIVNSVVNQSYKSNKAYEINRKNLELAKA